MRLHTSQNLRFINHVHRPLESASEADSKRNDFFHLRLYIAKILVFYPNWERLTAVGKFSGFVQRDSFFILGGVW